MSTAITAGIVLSVLEIEPTEQPGCAFAVRRKGSREELAGSFLRGFDTVALQAPATFGRLRGGDEFAAVPGETIQNAAELAALATGCGRADKVRRGVEEELGREVVDLISCAGQTRWACVVERSPRQRTVRIDGGEASGSNLSCRSAGMFGDTLPSALSATEAATQL